MGLLVLSHMPTCSEELSASPASSSTGQATWQSCQQAGSWVASLWEESEAADAMACEIALVYETAHPWRHGLAGADAAARERSMPFDDAITRSAALAPFDYFYVLYPVKDGSAKTDLLLP